MAYTITPADASALEARNLEECVAGRVQPALQALNAFTNNVASHYATPKKSPDTTVICMTGKTFALAGDQLQHLFRCLEACRRADIVTHFGERQGTETIHRTGIMLDFDVITRDPKTTLTDMQAYRLTMGVMLQLSADIDFHNQMSKNAKPSWVVGFTLRRTCKRVADANDLWKYGFHILVPGIRLERAYKRHLIAQLRNSPIINEVLTEMGAISAEQCLDGNSASVPVLFVGSCKLQSEPYRLTYAYEATLSPYMPPMIRPAMDVLLAEGVNVVAELSLLGVEASYENSAPIVRKQEFFPKAGLELKGDVAADAADVPDAAGCELEILLLDHEARYVHALLDMLPSSYSEEYQLWRNVIFALSSAGENYKTLAIWFSQKCPAKFNLLSVEELWASAMAAPPAARLTLKSIAHWARQENPEKFAEANKLNVYQMLLSQIYKAEGKFANMTIAPLLHRMFGHKYVCDVPSNMLSTRATWLWYEFVSPDDPMCSGEVWKWRQEPYPESLWNHVHTTLDDVMDKIVEHFRERIAACDDEIKIKYYKGMLSKFNTSRMQIKNTTFIDKTISGAEKLFRQRGFHAAMDQKYDLLGVANGVLRVGRRVELITGFHNLPVSKYTPFIWKPFNAQDPWIRRALKVVEDIVVEDDAREWILMHAAQGLYSGPKDGLMLLWEGGGANGKTTFLRSIAEALGPYGNKFNIQLLCGRREEADRPNSAVMVFKHCNYMYCEESSKGEIMNEARMKEVINVGRMSAREMMGRQETFKVRSNVVVASQYNLTLQSSDHGLWRRVRAYKSKRSFKVNPVGELERPVNPKILKQWVEDPEYLSAWLSIMQHYYERLQNEYDGDLANVRCATIERETENFRISQDTVHRWISQCVIRAPTTGCVYDLSSLAEHYKSWYSRNIDARKVRSAHDIIGDMENSALSNSMTLTPNGVKVLIGFRLVDHTQAVSSELVTGESWFSPNAAPKTSAANVAVATRDQWWEPPAVAQPPACAPCIVPPNVLHDPEDKLEIDVIPDPPKKQAAVAAAAAAAVQQCAPSVDTLLNDFIPVPSVVEELFSPDELEDFIHV